MGYSDILLMKPFILWMTGLPCSGKTTIIKDLQNILILKILVWPKVNGVADAMTPP